MRDSVVHGIDLVDPLDLHQLVMNRLSPRAAKVCGAGGGGCLFCYGPPDRHDAIREALASGGARLLEFRIDRQGLAQG